MNLCQDRILEAIRTRVGKSLVTHYHFRVHPVLNEPRSSLFLTLPLGL